MSHLGPISKVSFFGPILGVSCSGLIYLIWENGYYEEFTLILLSNDKGGRNYVFDGVNAV